MGGANYGSGTGHAVSVLRVPAGNERDGVFKPLLRIDMEAWFAKGETPFANEEQKSRLEGIKARALIDDGFKQKLFADPVGVLRAEGVEIQSLATASGELSVGQLDQVSAGTGSVMGWLSENVLGPAWSAIVSAVGSTDDNKDDGNSP